MHTDLRRAQMFKVQNENVEDGCKMLDWAIGVE